jgi:hypothetical protein
MSPSLGFGSGTERRKNAPKPVNGALKIATFAVTEQTYYRWRKEYRGLKTDEARRMKDL